MRSEHFLPVLLLVFAVLGCSQLRDAAGPNTSGNTAVSNGSTADANTTNPSESLPGTITATADPQADIASMADKFLNKKSFGAKITGYGDKETRTDLEFVAPDRFRVKTGENLETIVIGKDVYISMNGSFQKLPGAMGDTVPDLRKTFDKEGRKWFSDVKFVGEEMTNGKPALVYAYQNQGPGIGVGENESKVWISKQDGLPIKIEATYKSGTTKSMRIEYDFETPVTIEPPVTKK